VFFDELEIPPPKIHLRGGGEGGHGAQTGRLMIDLEPALEELAPALVVVVGDVNSTLAAALVASKLHLPLAHVEAGLRSSDRSMPEEINRILTDQLSDLLFTTCEQAAENLRREGIDATKIHFVGNVMIDTLRRVQARARSRPLPGPLAQKPPDLRFALATLHRPTNVDDPRSLDALLDMLAELSARLPVLVPLHPRTARGLSAERRASLPPALHLIEPLGYLDFLTALDRAALVLTDSGGVQEEAAVLGTPCLTLRDNTERPVTVALGGNRVVGRAPARILAAAHTALDTPPPPPATIPLWDGRAAPRIAALIEGYLGS